MSTQCADYLSSGKNRRARNEIERMGENQTKPKKTLKRTNKQSPLILAQLNKHAKKEKQLDKRQRFLPLNIKYGKACGN